VPTRPSNLPDFERPPVTEVVLSLQFGSLVALKSAHIGFLWAKFRDRYPNVTEQPPIDPVFETFGAPQAVNQPQIRFEHFTTPPLPRYWFEADDGSLCQVQQDRIIHNWRKRETEYPRYEAVREEFVRDVATFEEFLQSENLGSLHFNQSEISYINTIDLPDGADPHGAIEQVTSVWKRLDAVDRDLEDVFFRARYLMRKGGTPHARLHVTFTPAIRTTTMAHVVRLDMTFRGKPEGDDVEAAFLLLDEGRAAIVKAFAEMTTPDMHKHWGRTDG
jgi:uncharacterized protein (TIGR04255 family)